MIWLQIYTFPFKAKNNSPTNNYYWNQLLAIIGNYCLSQPQQEAQEPAHQRLFAIVNQLTIAAIVVGSAAVLTAIVVIQFGVINERAVAFSIIIVGATVFSAATVLATVFDRSTVLGRSSLLRRASLLG